jgi:hypothetical protein
MRMPARNFSFSLTGRNATRPGAKIAGGDGEADENQATGSFFFTS